MATALEKISFHSDPKETLAHGGPDAPGPIFPSGCEGKLGVALESLQGLRDLT